MFLLHIIQNLYYDCKCVITIDFIIQEAPLSGTLAYTIIQESSVKSVMTFLLEQRGDNRFSADSYGRISLYLQRIGQCSGGSNLSADRYPIDRDDFTNSYFQVAVCVFNPVFYDFSLFPVPPDLRASYSDQDISQDFHPST